jgi:hypothetical protein
MFNMRFAPSSPAQPRDWSAVEHATALDYRSPMTILRKSSGSTTLAEHDLQKTDIFRIMLQIRAGTNISTPEGNFKQAGIEHKSWRLLP